MNFSDFNIAYDIINRKSFNITAVESLVASMIPKEDAEYFVKIFKENNVFSNKILYNI